MNDWLELLRAQVTARGQGAVAQELEISRSTVSLLLAGKYPAKINKMRLRVERLYGPDGLVQCPVLGALQPDVCGAYLRLARELGCRGGNPQTLRLRKACLQCDKRSRP